MPKSDLHLFISSLSSEFSSDRVLVYDLIVDWLDLLLYRPFINYNTMRP